ncbi:MAG: hypothetical protein Q7S14_02510 [bacterium]|nr:hypothetical protein [bacterium]
MKKTLLVFSFFVLNISLLGVSLFLLSTTSKKYSSTAQIYSNASPSYSAYPEVLGAFTEAKLVASDARAGIVNNYLTKYNSPFQGLGSFIVEMADKYSIPFGIIPAISQCESNVGKIIPYGSYNAWGWNIYGENKLAFDNWFHAIETVSKGLGKNYYGKGLDTPEKIMAKYTPSSNGSWARCVTQYLAEIQ